MQPCWSLQNQSATWDYHYTNTHVRPFNGPLSVSGSGISWAVCKSASRSRQTTTSSPHHSVFYRPDALPATQPTASKHWRQEITTTMTHSPLSASTNVAVYFTKDWKCANKQSAPRSRQITTPTPHHSIFTGRMLFLTHNSVKAWKAACDVKMAKILSEFSVEQKN